MIGLFMIFLPANVVVADSPARLPLAFFFVMKKLLLNIITALLYAADQFGIRRGWWR